MSSRASSGRQSLNSFGIRSRSPSGRKSRSRSPSGRTGASPSSRKSRSHSPSGRTGASPSSRKSRSRSPSGRTGASPSSRKSHSRSTSGRTGASPSARKSRSPSTKKNPTSLGKEPRTPKNSDQNGESPPGSGSSSSSSDSSSASPSRSVSAGRERISKSAICNLSLPVARVKSMIKVHNHGLRVSDKTAIFTTAVLNYLACEILELSTNVVKEEGRSRIQLRHVNRAVKTDPELSENFRNASIPSSIFMPLSEMLNDSRTTPPQTQGMSDSVPGPSNASTTPVSPRSRKSGGRGITRRRG